jgi:hypothetical protein
MFSSIFPTACPLPPSFDDKRTTFSAAAANMERKKEESNMECRRQANSISEQ